MRTIAFEEHGGAGGSQSREGSIIDLLKCIPYVFAGQLIPPVHVINDLLSKGVYDAGMSGGCSWEPFEISEQEWDELRAELLVDPEEDLRYVEPPAWAATFADWNRWIWEFRYGVPGAELHMLEARIKELEAERHQALKDGNHTLAEDLELKVHEAGWELSEFFMKHVKRDGPAQPES